MGQGKGRKLTRQNKPQDGNQRTVAQIKHTAGPAPEAQGADPIKHGIGKDVNGTGATGGKGSPLPMVIFGTEQEIHHEDGDGGRGDNHEAVAQEQEAEHVVDSAEPDRVHDEVELDKDGTKGEDADEEHRRQRTEVALGRRDLTRDLVGADGVGGIVGFEG